MTKSNEQIVDAVMGGIIGRSATSREGLMLLADIVGNVDGDHLEIGTLFGASAIVCALAKKNAKREGKIFCIDPLNGYYIGARNKNGADIGSEIDKPSGKKPTMENLLKNCKEFGVELEIIQKKSDPFPEELKGRKFATVYIDGDHWNGAPARDWNSIKDNVDSFVIFHDCTPEYSHVTDAYRRARKEVPSAGHTLFADKHMGVVVFGDAWMKATVGAAVRGLL